MGYNKNFLKIIQTKDDLLLSVGLRSHQYTFLLRYKLFFSQDDRNEYFDTRTKR